VVQADLGGVGSVEFRRYRSGAGLTQPAREFSLADHEDARFGVCLDIFYSNVPEFLAEAGITESAAFLKRGDCHYCVLVSAGDIIGCGGICLRMPGVAGLAWGMVHQARHGRGAGKALLSERMQRCRSMLDADRIMLNTTAKTCSFSSDADSRSAGGGSRAAARMIGCREPFLVSLW
jgi:GNAT superfamily N-acetyltransferase